MATLHVAIRPLNQEDFDVGIQMIDYFLNEYLNLKSGLSGLSWRSQ